MNGEIRTLIREVLGEELARLKSERSVAPAPRPQVREETVAISSDSELACFVSRLLDLTRDGEMRRSIAEGRYVFRLGAKSQPAANPASPAAPQMQTVRIDKGFLSERQIDALPLGTTQLAVGKAVRFTPLARDRLKARGIALERT
jgi:hypothetical protein